MSEQSQRCSFCEFVGMHTTLKKNLFYMTVHDLKVCFFLNRHVRKSQLSSNVVEAF